MGYTISTKNLYIILAFVLGGIGTGWGQTPAEVKSLIKKGATPSKEAIEKALQGKDTNRNLFQSLESDINIYEESSEQEAEQSDKGKNRVESRGDQSVSNKKPSETILKPFGYDVFNYSALTFEPLVNVATPEDYVIGPSDEIIITVWGETQLYHTVKVKRNGAVVIPNVGLVSVNGLTLEGLKRKLYKRMTKFYASLRYGRAGARSFLDVSLGKLKTIRVFVLGEVKKPGGYVLSSLSTVFTALYYSGGATSKGSLREIIVKRNGKKISSIDLYDYLIKADNSKDIRLENGDIVLVKPRNKVVTLKGKVFRPAIYELKKEETFEGLIAIAGGFNFDADINRILLERTIPFEQRESYANDILLINFKASESKDVSLTDGDIITVYAVNNSYENYVAITGAISKPGVYALELNMKLSDLIRKAGGLIGDAFQEKAEIVRTNADLSKEIIPFNANKAIEDDNSVMLQNLDKIRIYSVNEFKDTSYVIIDGAVRKPGKYILLDSMSVTSLILKAGGYSDKVSSKEIEVYRIDSTDVYNYSKGYKVKVSQNLERISESEKFYLEEYDRIFVRENPAFKLQKTVQIEGEAYYTGVYPIESNKGRISDILKKAGGLKEDAFLDGFQFTRQDKVVFIDLKDVLKRPKKSKYDIFLRDHDFLFIPKNPNMVKVAGEVMTPALVLFQHGKGLDFYLDQAGGITDNADKKRVQVKLANGKMWKERILWFDPPLTPGTYITVPAKVEKESKFWEHARDITGILSGLATTILIIDRILGSI